MARLLLSKPIDAHGRIAPDLDLQVASDILIADDENNDQGRAIGSCLPISEAAKHRGRCM